MPQEKETQTVLTFDTSLQGLSCGVVCFQKESSKKPSVYSIMRPMSRGQSENLVPDMQRLLGYAGCGFNTLDLIVSTRGPGAFTGLRIGLSVAKAFRMTLDCPVIGLATPDLLARQYCYLTPQAAGNIRVVLETKRQDFYTSLYDPKAKLIEGPISIDSEALTNGIDDNEVIIGDGTKRLSEKMPHLKMQCEGGFDLIDPLVMAKMGAESNVRAENEENMALDPIYLRGADVSKSKQSYRVLGE